MPAEPLTPEEEAALRVRHAESTDGEGVFPWITQAETDRDRLLATLDAERAAHAATLDVGALAEAVRPYFGPSYWPGRTDATILGESPLAIATAIAAAYRARVEGRE